MHVPIRGCGGDVSVHPPDRLRAKVGGFVVLTALERNQLTLLLGVNSGRGAPTSPAAPAPRRAANARNANLLAEYKAARGNTLRPASELTKITWPTARRSAFGQRHRANHVDLEGASPIVDAGVRDAVEQRHPGVVHQHVVLVGHLGARFDACGVGQIRPTVVGLGGERGIPGMIEIDWRAYYRFDLAASRQTPMSDDQRRTVPDVRSPSIAAQALFQHLHHQLPHKL